MLIKFRYAHVHYFFSPGLYFSLVTAQLAKDEEIAEALEEEDMVEDLETGEQSNET